MKGIKLKVLIGILICLLAGILIAGGSSLYCLAKNSNRSQMASNVEETAKTDSKIANKSSATTKSTNRNTGKKNGLKKAVVSESAALSDNIAVPKIKNDPNHTLTIKCIGDSVTQGMSLPDEYKAVIGGETYPSVLYTILNGRMFIPFFL